MDEAGGIKSLMKSLQLGEYEADFLSEKFDVKEHANTALQCGISISDQLARLSEGILLLNKELHAQVVAHHDDLLSQATGVETLEGVLQLMQTRIQSLLATTERIRSRVTEPFNRITIRMNQLTRLQETCDMLRRIIRMVYLCKRLRGQLQGGAREITKAAQSLSELDYLSEGVDLSGIDILEKDRLLISQARVEVENQARKMIDNGMHSQMLPDRNLIFMFTSILGHHDLQFRNQSQVATALQVFYNLNLLSPTVCRLLENCRTKVEQNITSALDINLLSSPGPEAKHAGPGRVNMPANTALFRANLWTGMEKLMDTLYTSCSQVQHLQKVLMKKRDPVTQVCFITEYAKDNNPHIIREHWDDIMKCLGKKLQGACQVSNHLKQAFEGEYPKLLRLCSELWTRLIQHVQIAMSDQASVIDETTDGSSLHQFEPESGLRQAINLCENAYLSRSLSRLFDPINLVFPQGSLTLPSVDELDGIMKTISSELSVTSFDSKLSIAVAKNVAKTIKLFSVKCEQLLCTDGEASQVINVATPGQKRNATAVNSLQHLLHAVKILVDSLPHYEKEGLQAITRSLQSIEALMNAAVQPLLSSINDCMEAIILTMHQEDFSSDNASQSESQCSLYMRELQGFLARVQGDYLSLFDCQEFIMESVHPVVCKSIELFVRHASLLRPMGEGGKMRLAADFAQMELAVNPLCRRVGDLGKSYKLLRAFRPMLFQSNANIPQNHAIGDIIPYSTIIHFLFTRAPEELKSPHQILGWSLSRYTQWLDDHPQENDRLTLIKGSLESYVKSVSARQGTEYASVYPIMLELLQKGSRVEVYIHQSQTL